MAAIDRLKSQRHTTTTAKQYYVIWKIFNKFNIRLDHKPKRWEDKLTLFIGHLVSTNRQSSTIKSYISAIKAVLLEVNHELTEDKILLHSLTRACKLRNDRVRHRFPIGKGLLKLILQSTEKLLPDQPYLTILYQTMFLTAYFGMFRIGEITLSDHVVKVSDVQIGVNKKKMMFILRSSKTHNTGSQSQIIKISSTASSGVHNSLGHFCPFTSLQKYVSIRRKQVEPNEQFFIFRDRAPVKAYHFRKILKAAIKKIGLDDSLYESHSLRIGRGTQLLKIGLSVETIKKLGHWRSNAVYAYLRC